MATVDASGSSPLNSSIAIQETGSRNKRKYRADPPLADPNVLADALQAELTNYNLFPIEKPAEVPDLEHHTSICNMCRTSMFGLKEGPELDEFQDVDWSCLTESQLEEILLSNLDMVFRAAIKMITCHGYAEEVATNAVLSSGLCYGYKDTVSNVVDNALAFLRSGQEVDSSPRENVSEDLKKLEKSVLADMISVLREVRPFFSTGDAMWRLLMSDANISHACSMDSNPSNSVRSDEYSGTSTVPQLEAEVMSNNTTSIAPDINVQGPKVNDVISSSEITQHSETIKVQGIPNLPSRSFSASNEDKFVSKTKSLKEGSISLSNHVQESPSIVYRSQHEERTISSRKFHVSSSKKESVLRQKSIHFEKSYRALGSKAVSRTCKQSGLGSLIFDRKCKPISDSTTISLKSSSLKITKVPGIEKSLADANLNLSFSHGHSSSPNCSTKEVSSRSSGPTTNTELSLSLPSESSTGLSITPEPIVEAPSSSTYGSTNSNMICRDWVPEDKKDEMMLILVPLMHELQAQLQDWTDWAQQKVMQAARRLSKEKAELQSLRQEKEEVARLQKERHALEENTRKKLAEMELAISKASAQVERANAAARRLEFENTQLRLGMEAAKMHAAESAASCQEASRKEIRTLKMFQSWEKQQVLFQEELATEKHQLSQLQQQLEQVEELRDHSKARWKQEEKLKKEALAEANAERKEREQIETSAKSQENALRLEAENDLQRCKNDIRRLEQQIAQLRLVADSSNITALKWGTDKSYASRLSDGRKNINANILAKIIDSQESASEEVQRERECVMCLSEEMSVVFLPCAHQVVCIKCNELHEKQGMKDCPSCRTPIQRRVLIRSA
ncbi:hypothetical protein Cni_G24504 [Canna indica]|uniref:RING-type domain-containing protein n=1 Tax=Canna indica TaxID=4628 RepID=A0AAQ3KVF7_9LILI|nr:hypothetical protein Cni_G24504 [Canna indica]